MQRVIRFFVALICCVVFQAHAAKQFQVTAATRTWDGLVLQGTLPAIGMRYSTAAAVHAALNAAATPGSQCFGATNYAADARINSEPASMALNATALAGNTCPSWGVVTISVKVVDPPAQCSDGIDNDGDGKTDYPADPDCTSADDDSEAPPPSICSQSAGDLVGQTALHPDGQWTQVIAQKQSDGKVRGCMSPPTKGGECEINAVGDSAVWQGGEVENGHAFIGIWRYTGAACTDVSGELPVQAGSEDEQPPCKTVLGQQVCATEDKKCIQINGERTCYSDAGGVCVEGQCLSPINSIDEYLQTLSGARVTKGQAPTPPVPNKGVDDPLTPANPDGRLVGQIGGTNPNYSTSYNTYNYYSPQTVSNSCVDNPDTSVNECAGGGSGGDCPEGQHKDGNGQCVSDTVGGECQSGYHKENGQCVADGGGDGDCDPTEEDCDEGGGGGECPAGAECGFVAPKSGGGFADARSGVQAAQAELQAEFTKIRQEINDMGSQLSTSAGELPCTSFSMLGSTVPFCLSEYQSALSIIAKALMAVVVFIAAMIILKAD